MPKAETFSVIAPESNLEHCVGELSIRALLHNWQWRLRESQNAFYIKIYIQYSLLLGGKTHMNEAETEGLSSELYQKPRPGDLFSTA